MSEVISTAGRFEKSTVTIRNRGGEAVATVPCQTYKGLAVHKPNPGPSGHVQPFYVITHIASGKSICPPFNRLGGAKRFAIRAADRWDFTQSEETVLKSVSDYDYGLLRAMQREEEGRPTTRSKAAA